MWKWISALKYFFISAPRSSDQDAPNPTKLLAAVQKFYAISDVLLTQLELHKKLLQLEWKEEKKRLKNIFLFSALGFICVLCVMLLGGAILIAFFWQTIYCAPAIIFVLSLYVVLALIAYFRCQQLMQLGEQAFSGTRAELAADLAIIKKLL